MHFVLYWEKFKYCTFKASRKYCTFQKAIVSGAVDETPRPLSPGLCQQQLSHPSPHTTATTEIEKMVHRSHPSVGGTPLKDFLLVFVYIVIVF
jgi:hypothetical protein